MSCISRKSMNSIFRFIVVLLLLLPAFLLSGQSRNGLYSMRGGGGSGTHTVVVTPASAGYLFGDLGETSKIMSDHFGYMPSVSYRYSFENRMALKLNVMYAKFKHRDNQTANMERDYKSTIQLGVASVNFEYTLFGGAYADYPSSHSVYISGGAGLIYSNIDILSANGKIIKETDLFGSKITFRNKLNVQCVTYSPVLPVGVGYEYEISPSWTIGVEGKLLIPFSDYIDGISPSGSKHFDYMMNAGISVAYKFGQSYGSNRWSW